jgi:hypothetical protein
MFSRVLVAWQMLGQSRPSPPRHRVAKELKRTQKSLTLDQFPAKGWLILIRRCFTTMDFVLFYRDEDNRELHMFAVFADSNQWGDKELGG